MIHRNGLCCHIGTGCVCLIQPDYFTQLLEPVQIGATFHCLEGVIFKKHTVTHRIHDFLFGLEVVVYRTFRKASQFIHDVLNRGVLVALFQKEALSNIQNPLLGDFRVFVSCHNWVSPTCLKHSLGMYTVYLF